MRVLVWSLLLMSLLIIGCAAPPVRTDGSLAPWPGTPPIFSWPRPPFRANRASGMLSPDPQ